MRIARLLLSSFFLVGMSAIPVQSRAQVAVGISVRFGPPVLPVYEQPICPEPGFIWVPGYWAYGDDGYFWVPGTWVEPPEVGLLWTPGYWGFDDGFYLWHAGYWGPEVGFYGGINYGFGYPGVGFYGGYWRGGNFFYNRAVTNVNVEVVHNTYETRVVNNNVSRVSFNGGQGGVNARPTSAELRAETQHHVQITSAQAQQRQIASSNRTMLASVNHGRPDIAATPRPGQFNAKGAASTNAHANNRPFDSNRPQQNPPVTNPRADSGRIGSDRPPNLQPRENVPANPSKQQQEMEKMQQKQTQERQRMEQQQSKEQQKLVQQRANQQRQEQLQQRQQRQQQQLQSKHDQQTQKLQQRQQRDAQRQPARPPARPPSSGKPHDQ